MKAELIVYKSLLGGEELVRKGVGADIRLSLVLHQCEEIRSDTVMVWVNNAPIHHDDWALFILKQFDRIEVVARIEKGPCRLSVPFLAQCWLFIQEDFRCMPARGCGLPQHKARCMGTRSDQ